MTKEPEPLNEKRRYTRITKNFILSYFSLEKPRQKHSISQLKNISLGGMCFITEEAFEPGTRLGVELNTPYLSGTTYLEGQVLESREKVALILYETRLQFDKLSTDAQFVLKEMIDFFINGDKNSHE